MTPLLKRLGGEVIAPSLMLYSRGWNDSRQKMIDNINDRFGELKGELKSIK